jgi:hypothetical protein
VLRFVVPMHAAKGASWMGHTLCSLGRGGRLVADSRFLAFLNPLP